MHNIEALKTELASAKTYLQEFQKIHASKIKTNEDPLVSLIERCSKTLTELQKQALAFNESLYIAFAPEPWLSENLQKTIQDEAHEQLQNYIKIKENNPYLMAALDRYLSEQAQEKKTIEGYQAQLVQEKQQRALTLWATLDSFGTFYSMLNKLVPLNRRMNTFQGSFEVNFAEDIDQEKAEKEAIENLPEPSISKDIDNVLKIKKEFFEAAVKIKDALRKLEAGANIKMMRKEDDVKTNMKYLLENLVALKKILTETDLQKLPKVEDLLIKINISLKNLENMADIVAHEKLSTPAVAEEEPSAAPTPPPKKNESIQKPKERSLSITNFFQGAAQAAKKAADTAHDVIAKIASPRRGQGQNQEPLPAADQIIKAGEEIIREGEKQSSLSNVTMSPALQKKLLVKELKERQNSPQFQGKQQQLLKQQQEPSNNAESPESSIRMTPRK